MASDNTQMSDPKDAQIATLKRRIAILEEQSAEREESMAQSRAVETALLNATSDLAGIIDQKGVILSISDAAAARINQSPQQLIGSCVYDFFPPEMIGFRKAYVQLVSQSGQFIRFEDHVDDTTLLVCIYPITDRDGQTDRLAVFVADTTELNRNENLLHRYSQILSTINDPIAYIDKQHRYQTVNEAALHIYGFKKKSDMLERHVRDIVGEKVYQEQFKPHLDRCLEGEKVYNQDWFEFPGVGRRCMYMSFYPLFAKDNVVSGAVLNAIDVTKMKELEEKLLLLSQTDQLTQAYNRVKFNDALEQEIARERRYPESLSLIMLDIDHFKRVNDTYGHDVGDQVLVTMTKIVRQCIRETDILARWGGEEFMLLLPHTTLENAVKLAERIRIKVEQTEIETVKHITGSFGVTMFSPMDNGETFTKRADRALYKAKQTGRNRVIAAAAKPPSP